jgi:hypothetical protein
MKTPDERLAELCGQMANALQENKGVLLRHLGDLIHDGRVITSNGPDTTFSWFLYDSGTHIVVDGPERKDCDELKDCVRQTFDIQAEYHWDGETLTKV